MAKDAQRGLSTSALARELDKTSKQMFTELAALGWIRREDEHWKLTAKGEFEQGSYRASDKFGTYIVWPRSVLEHPALVKFASRHWLISDLAEHLQADVTLTERLLVEMGWIRAYLNGWQLTSAGKLQGGVQHEEQDSGTPQVLWEKSVQNNPVLQQRLALAKAEDSRVVQHKGMLTLDGRLVANQGCAMIANWLYLANVRFAVHRPLPGSEEHLADFYLPDAGVFIEYWCDELNAAELAEKMTRKNYYASQLVDVMDLRSKDLQSLDKTLTRFLLKHGVVL